MKYMVCFAAALLGMACGKKATATFPDLDAPSGLAADFTVDSDTGLPTSRTRLLVALEEEATGADVTAVVAALKSAKLVGAAPELHTVLLAIPESSDHTAIHNARAAVKKLKVVTTAEADVALSPNSLPPSVEATLSLAAVHDDNLCVQDPGLDWTWPRPAEGSNWAQAWANFPGMWNWNDYIKKVNGAVVVGVLDGGKVDSTHPELTGLVTYDGDASAVVSEHATHVTGIIAASWSDKKYINGATPFATIVNELPATSAQTLTSAGELMLTNFRQLVRHKSARVINMSLGFNWNANLNGTDHGCLVEVVTPSPNVTTARQNMVNAQGLIAVRMARYLGSLPLPIFIVTSAGNDSIDASEFQGTPENAEGWYRVQAKWNNPFCNAAALNSLDNVFCVEALQKTSDHTAVNRALFSNVGGTVSAPGAFIASSVPAGTYKNESGTSQAAPQVTGLIAHLLAYKADLTAQQVYDAVVGNARAGGADTAPGIDGFAAMLSLPEAVLHLFDVDDGTADGDDLTVASDAHGDGTVDMKDFRRVRDGYLWVSQRRDFLDITGAGGMKLDLNEDGALSADASATELYPRFDVDNDGILSNTDITVMSTLLGKEWTDAHVPLTALPALAVSGDLQIDASDVIAAGATSVTVGVAGAPYELKITAGVQTYTVPVTSAATSLVLTGTAAGGSLTIQNAAVTLGWGQRQVVKLVAVHTGGTGTNPPPPH